MEEKTNLNPQEEDQVYELYRRFNPWDHLKGYYGVFRGDKLIPIDGILLYNSKGRATQARNELIGKVQLIAEDNQPQFIQIPNDPGMWTEYHDDQDDVDRVNSEKLVPIVPIDNISSSLWNLHEFDIRSMNPNLFKRLSDLFIVREITEQDLAGLVNLSRM